MKNLKAYHGSPGAITSPFQPSERGTFGTGIYFGDFACADLYAESGVLYECEIALASPLVVKADYELGEAFDIETPALPLLRALYGLPSNRAAAELFNTLTDNHHLGGEIKSAALGAGFDGLVLKYAPGTFEVVIYDPQTIISRTEVAVEPSPADSMGPLQ